MDLALRAALAAVLLAAALGKARAPGGAAERLGEHGVPERLRRPAAAALVLVEAGLGVALAAGVGTRWAAAAAAVLFTLFALAFLRRRLRGVRRAPCGCLGRARERSTLAVSGRAAALAVLAAFLAAGGPAPAVPTGEAALWLAVGVLGVLVLALAVLVLALYRQVGVLSLRLGPRVALELEDEGPPLGAPAPPLRGLARRGPELVAFASPSCRLCAELAPGLRALAREGLPLHELVEGADGGAFSRWRVPGTPYVVYLEDGIVAAKGLVNTLEQVDGVIATGVERRRAAA
jgi:hypothetical protein